MKKILVVVIALIVLFVGFNLFKSHNGYAEDVAGVTVYLVITDYEDITAFCEANEKITEIEYTPNTLASLVEEGYSVYHEEEEAICWAEEILDNASVTYSRSSSPTLTNNRVVGSESDD